MIFINTASSMIKYLKTILLYMNSFYAEDNANIMYAFCLEKVIR